MADPTQPTSGAVISEPTIPPGPWDRPEVAHLITREEVAAAWSTDRLLTDFGYKLAGKAAKTEEAISREIEAQSAADALEGEAAELESKLKLLRRQIGVHRGVVSSARYTQRLMKNQSDVLHRKIHQRRQQVWKNELNRRLREVGKGIRLQTGVKRKRSLLEIVEANEVSEAQQKNAILNKQE